MCVALCEYVDDGFVFLNRYWGMVLMSDGFWVLVCYAATQLATQLRQRCIQVVCSNKEARKCLTESNGISAMDLRPMNVVLKGCYFSVLFDDCCFEVDIRIRRYTNKRTIKQNKHEQEQTYFEL